MKFHWIFLCIWYLPESRRLQKESCRRTISPWWLCCDKVKLLWTFNKRWRVKKPGELVPHGRLWFCLVWRRCDRFNGYMDDSWQQQSTVLHCPVVFRPRSFQNNLQRIGVYDSTYCTPESARSKNIVKFRIIVKNDKNRHNWWSTDTEVVKCRVHQKSIDRALSMKSHFSFQTQWNFIEILLPCY